MKDCSNLGRWFDLQSESGMRVLEILLGFLSGGDERVVYVCYIIALWLCDLILQWHLAESPPILKPGPESPSLVLLFTEHGQHVLCIVAMHVKPNPLLTVKFSTQ